MLNQILEDFWVHLGGLILIAIGLLDHWFFTKQTFGPQMDLGFVLFGVAALGVKLGNGYVRVQSAARGNP